MRQVVLDTETTGLEPSQGHRIIEIGAIEMVDRRATDNRFHRYVNPGREIDEAAIEVHGITLEKLRDESPFDDVAVELLEFLKGAELIIHNAPFDVGFLNYEFSECGYGDGVIERYCEVLDTLVMARQKHPGQKNSLDALCTRYQVDNSQRTLHGALLDAEILADVYLRMTGGQMTLLGESADITRLNSAEAAGEIDVSEYQDLPVIRATPEELAGHEEWMALLRKECEDGPVEER